jgi:hypothetical protein
MSGKWIGTHAVGRCQAWLMRPVIYSGPVRGRARDPLEWFPSDMPILHCLVAPRLTLGSVLRDWTEGESL